jgi:hypothetical protein
MKPKKPIEQAKEDLAASKASGEHDAFIRRAEKIVEAGAKFKKALLSRNLTRGRAKCPMCDTGFLHGRIVGPRFHLRFRCDSCDVFMME